MKDIIYEQADQSEALTNLGIIFSLIATTLDFTVVPTYAEKLFKDDQLLGSIVFWLILALVSFIIGGGFRTAIKTVVRITEIAWHLIPFFPIDLFIAAIAFVAVACLSLWFPVIFVIINRIQISKDKRIQYEG